MFLHPNNFSVRSFWIRSRSSHVYGHLGILFCLQYLFTKWTLLYMEVLSIYKEHMQACLEAHCSCTFVRMVPLVGNELIISTSLFCHLKNVIITSFIVIIEFHQNVELLVKGIYYIFISLASIWFHLFSIIRTIHLTILTCLTYIILTKLNICSKYHRTKHIQSEPEDKNTLMHDIDWNPRMQKTNLLAKESSTEERTIFFKVLALW